MVNFGEILINFWWNFGQSLGSILFNFWSIFDEVLINFWVKFWWNFDEVLVNFWFSISKLIQLNWILRHFRYLWNCWCRWWWWWWWWCLLEVVNQRWAPRAICPTLVNEANEANEAALFLRAWGDHDCFDTRPTSTWFIWLAPSTQSTFNYYFFLVVVVVLQSSFGEILFYFRSIFGPFLVHFWSIFGDVLVNFWWNF